MCHEVDLDNISKILVTLVVEVGIRVPLTVYNIWISRNKFIFEGITSVKYQIKISSLLSYKSPNRHLDVHPPPSSVNL